jgi:hypothetical protein
VSCTSCGSDNVEAFESEIIIHYKALKDIKKSPVVVYENVSVCLNCGNAKFTVPQTRLSLLAKDSKPRRSDCLATGKEP